MKFSHVFYSFNLKLTNQLMEIPLETLGIMVGVKFLENPIGFRILILFVFYFNIFGLLNLVVYYIMIIILRL